MNLAPSVAVVILAAGGSKRLGQPKQLLPYRDTTIIGHIVKQALASTASNTVAVIGASADQLRTELDRFSINIVENDAWQDGMASSIRVGIQALEQLEMPPTAVLLMTADQPHVSTSLIDRLIDAYDHQPNRIVACEYEDTVGVPVLFDQSYFEQLKKLKGDHGAKEIIQGHADQVVTVDFPEGAYDIDNSSDLDKLRS